MAERIEFFFDFSSPFAYLASCRIEAIAARHGREVWWRPMMLGPALAASGNRPNIQVPLKGRYFERDVPRSARMLGIPFKMPRRFPLVTLTAARAFYWLEEAAPERAVPFAKAVFKAFFVEDRDVTDRGVLAELLAAVGADAQTALAAGGEARIKERLKAVTGEAVAHGVFGAPFILVDGEPFWGVDRLDQVEHWLATGGF